jgi:hypothetical protein
MVDYGSCGGTPSALKAISPQASPADMFLGDDFHHNGAFRLSYGFEYAFQEEISKSDSLFQFDKYDTYDWYLKLGALSNVNKKYFSIRSLPGITSLNTQTMILFGDANRCSPVWTTQESPFNM